MTNGHSLVVDVQDARHGEDSDGSGVADSAQIDGCEEPPSAAQLSRWAELAHQKAGANSGELTLRLVDDTEMQALNEQYRGKLGSTNVLSFAQENEFDFPSLEGLSDDEQPNLLGDIVICHSVIVREAHEQNKHLFDHYAHMVTHGVLHLHGFDHIDDHSAAEMEALEAQILSLSGIENPYS